METEGTGLAELIERGGIYRNITGTTSREVLTALVKIIPPIPTVSSDKLLEAVLEREALMSTSTGRCIALPHPRNPLINAESRQFTALAFLKNPVDWNSLDGERVDTLFFIISASAKQHLRTLSEINFFCRHNEFYQLLKNRANDKDILQFIRVTEESWKTDKLPL